MGKRAAAVETEVEVEVEAGSVPVWYGNPELRPHLVPLGRLSEDPANARRHGDQSIADIAGSFRRFGQQKDIVADRDWVVRAGNGTLRAVRALGWTHLAVVRSDLEPRELALYALADNRTAERAEWDYQALQAALRGAAAGGVAVDDLGWQPHELQPILEAEWTPPEADGSEAAGVGGDRPEMGAPYQVTRDQRRTIDAAVARVREMSRGVETSEGQALELIAADFLAGAGHAGEGRS